MLLSSVLSGAFFIQPQLDFAAGGTGAGFCRRAGVCHKCDAFYWRSRDLRDCEGLQRVSR